MFKIQRLSFLLALIIFTSIFSFSAKAFAATLVDTNIVENTIWTQDQSPYVVSANIAVLPNVTLTIEPGVVVKFNYGSDIFVKGKINALGTGHQPIYFTSNYDDAVGGSTDDETFCYEDIDINGNVLGEICETYDMGDPYIGDWDGIYFSNSINSTLKNVFFRYVYSALETYSSDINFENLNVNDSVNGLIAHENSRIEILGGFFDNLSDVIIVFNGSSLVFKDIAISNIFYDPITIFNDSSFVGENLTTDNIFSSHTDMIVVFNNSDLSIKNSSIKNCPFEACITFFDGRDPFYLTNPSSINIENTMLDGGLGSGLLTFGNTNISVNIKNSSFKNFNLFAVENYSLSQIDARQNFWGDPSGPYDANQNPMGLGDAIYGNVLFTPWLLTDPLLSCADDCFSNVLFLPGLMGSRLYKQDELIDKELWVSTDDFDHIDLSLDNQGKSIDSTIYTKNDTQKLTEDEEETGIVDEVNLNNLPDLNIYKSFINDLKKWKDDDKIIEDYAFIPYDWRLSLDDIITNGHISADNNLSYGGSQNFSESFILKKLEELQVSSRTGKVTIITHSNGGLVAKALVQKLKDTGNPLYEKIDKIIFVAVPQVGTPDAVAALLHGSELGHGFIMYKDRSRQLAENMASIYNFLPSEGYFDTVDPGFAIDKVASFENIPFFNPQTSQYGVFVSDEAELKNYILGTDSRTKPSFSDTLHPNIGNSALYTQAENVHEILDNWLPHPDTKIIQVAGWGEDTLAGIDYIAIRDVTEHLSLKPRWVVDGDGTVVVPSALWMSENNPNVERWWVDLDQYNQENSPDRVHRSILEISNLRDFIKSELMDIGFTDPENIILDSDSTLESDKLRLHYTLHSPLTLGITDAQGRYTGQDPITKQIREEIPNVTYRQIGEVQFISAPADLAYTVKMQGYEEGNFSFDVDKQLGNEITEFTSFQAIPSGTSTLATMDVTPNMEIENLVLKIDNNGDGMVDKTLPGVPDGEIIYDVTPPELQISFDINTKDVILSAQDNLDPNPTITITDSITLTDNQNNTTVIPFTKFREKPTKLKLSYNKIIRNGIITTVPSTNIVYDWQEKKGVLTDLDSKITIKGIERYTFSYNKAKDVTIIKEKTTTGTIITTRPGFVVVTIKTSGDSLVVTY